MVFARIFRSIGGKKEITGGTSGGGYFTRNFQQSCNSGSSAWAIAQGLKVLLTLAISRKFDYTRVLGSGGMPSSHSSMACAMVTVIGFHEGFSSAVFALAFCFAGVTMYDAAGVRRSTGRNAAVINHIVEGLSGKGFNFDDEHLKELVGHTPIQVLAGALLRILIGVLKA